MSSEIDKAPVNLLDSLALQAVRSGDSNLFVSFLASTSFHTELGVFFRNPTSNGCFVKKPNHTLYIHYTGFSVKYRLFLVDHGEIFT